jgi:hypothetical protein
MSIPSYTWVMRASGIPMRFMAVATNPLIAITLSNLRYRYRL